MTPSSTDPAPGVPGPDTPDPGPTPDLGPDRALLPRPEAVVGSSEPVLPPTSEGSSEAVAAVPRPLPPRFGARSIVLWVAGSLVAFALDGPWGLMAPFTIALVVLARLPRVWIGRIGLGLLAAVPLAVVWTGIPTRAQVSPRFVNRSAWPTHLTFVGLFLLMAWTLLELGPALRQSAGARREGLDHRRVEPVPRWSAALRFGVVGGAALFLAAAAGAVMRG